MNANVQRKTNTNASYSINVSLKTLYKATVTSDNCVKTYIGSTGQSFKKRWYGHCFSFRIENPKCIPCKAIRDSTSSSNSSDSSNSNLFCTHDTPMQYPTTLAEYVWKLKRNRFSYNIKWNILHKIRRPKSHHNACRLCNLEKIEIACAQGKNSLNKKIERTGKYKNYMKDFYKKPPQTL